MTEENWTYGKMPADTTTTLDMSGHLQTAVDNAHDQISQARESVFEERIREIVRDEITTAVANARRTTYSRHGDYDCGDIETIAEGVVDTFATDILARLAPEEPGYGGES